MNYEIVILDMQSENHPHGDPDDGCPQDALRDFLADWDTHKGVDSSHWKGEHNFIIWADDDTPGIYFANAFGGPEGNECTTYYKLQCFPCKSN